MRDVFLVRLRVGADAVDVHAAEATGGTVGVRSVHHALDTAGAFTRLNGITLHRKRAVCVTNAALPRSSDGTGTYQKPE